ncbi:hypothetical protein L6452_44221 [Arctium lappa]|uniref:Uncharacterized protein n=1 Tax=Arctium lappa TaxID=4217 RepID=A0ACB8XEP4_ARCLA|nr:hypothetical protein L6452_44221 [Arctium lappa]
MDNYLRPPEKKKEEDQARTNLEKEKSKITFYFGKSTLPKEVKVVHKSTLLETKKVDHSPILEASLSKRWDSERGVGSATPLLDVELGNTSGSKNKSDGTTDEQIKSPLSICNSKSLAAAHLNPKEIHFADDSPLTGGNGQNSWIPHPNSTFTHDTTFATNIGMHERNTPHATKKIDFYVGNNLSNRKRIFIKDRSKPSAGKKLRVVEPEGYNVELIQYDNLPITKTETNSSNVPEAGPVLQAHLAK